MRWSSVQDLLSMREDMNHPFNEFWGRTGGHEGT
jgi:hypothetical protein